MNGLALTERSVDIYQEIRGDEGFNVAADDKSWAPQFSLGVVQVQVGYRTGETDTLGAWNLANGTVETVFLRGVSFGVFVR